MHIIGTLDVGGAEKVVLNLHNSIGDNVQSSVTCLTKKQSALKTYGFFKQKYKFF